MAAANALIARMEVATPEYRASPPPPPSSREPKRAAPNPLTARRGAATPESRASPSTLDAEQPPLGPILVNNAPYSRFSVFLKSSHFSEALHRRIYEVATSLI